MTKKIKLAVVISHPIQHFCPQYVSFAENRAIEFKVFFGSSLGYRKYVDENFKQEIHWNNLQLEKFEHVFLNGEDIIQPDKNLDAPSLEKELSNFQPDILFTYGYFQKLQRRAYQWAGNNGVYLAYISDSELRHPIHRVKQFIKGFFLRKYFRNIDVFLTMGNANEAYYAAYKVPANKILRMHYPIDYVFYKQQYENRESLRSKIRLEYAIEDKDIVLTVVGKLVDWKNQDHLIQALYQLEDAQQKFHLFIIGSGEKKEEWEKEGGGLKKNKVYFTGFVTPEELPAYYAATDIYVHPASMEPHSVAISEAIFMGCPVILSDRCGSYGEEDDVQENKNGFVYPFGDIEILVDGITQLCNDQRKRNTFGNYSHKIAELFQQNSHESMMEGLMEKFIHEG